jgi:hypothetical protein
MFTRDVAAGVHRIEDAFTNWYIIETEHGLTIVDAIVTLDSPDALGATGAKAVPTGRREQWTDRIESAVAAAKAARLA